jgi:DNA processing protein
MKGLGDTPLSSAEKLQWLRLIRSPNVGPITFFRLLERFGSAFDAVNALPSISRGRSKPISLGEAEDEAVKLMNYGCRMIALPDPDYPDLLRNIDDPPPLITVRGNVSLLHLRSLGIVGSRNASANGKRFTRKIAADIGALGIVINSGLARGIDAEAHCGAQDTGTVGVIAGGIDNIYPKENAALYGKLAEQGTIISEMPFGAQPQPQHFPRRNRLISGLSLGVLVVEANARSGSLITARTALEQGREVFAVPGWPGDPRSRGANHLIRQGAVLVESAEDIVDNLGDPRPRVVPNVTTELRQTKKIVAFPGEDGQKAAPRDSGTVTMQIEKSLTTAPITVDELIRQCQFSTAEVTIALLELELAGRLERHPGNKVSLVGDAC